MATDWKSLTPEQREAINAKRREKYKTLPDDLKENYRAAKRSIYVPVEKPTAFRLKKPDGSTMLITNPEMVSWMSRLELRVKRRKAAFERRVDRIQEWLKAGGLYPSPNIQDKMDLTEQWLKIAETLGRKCCQCGDTQVLEFSWKLTRKDDFLCFIPFKKEEYDKVLKRPNDFCLYCVKCCFDLRIFTFYWLFSPFSPRNSGVTVAPDIGGDRYANWRTLWPLMYPADAELFPRIRSGAIRSLTCGIKRGGEFIQTFLRKNPYHGWVGTETRDLSPVVMQREYPKLYPTTYA